MTCERLGWANHRFEELVDLMVDADLERLGERAGVG